MSYTVGHSQVGRCKLLLAKPEHGLVGEFPPSGGSLRSPAYHLSSLFPYRLLHDCLTEGCAIASSVSQSWLRFSRREKFRVDLREAIARNGRLYPLAKTLAAVVIKVLGAFGPGGKDRSSRRLNLMTENSLQRDSSNGTNLRNI
jgi:hypothetical protein